MSLQQEVDQILESIRNPQGTKTPVYFYERAVYNEEKSKESKRPIYENRLYIKKLKSNISVSDSFARGDDIQSYPKEYDTFQRTKKEKEGGIPIGMLPGITPSEVLMLEGAGIFTVERVSQLDDRLMNEINPQLKPRALEYLDQGNKVEMLEKEVKELKKKLGVYESTNNGTKRSGRNNAIRETDNGNLKQQQGSQAVA